MHIISYTVIPLVIIRRIEVTFDVRDAVNFGNGPTNVISLVIINY